MDGDDASRPSSAPEATAQRSKNKYQLHHPVKQAHPPGLKDYRARSRGSSIQIGNRDPLLAQTTAEEFAEQAINPTGESERKLRNFLHAVCPRWFVVTPRPGRRPPEFGETRHDIDKVMAKLKDIGVTSVQELMLRVENTSINRDLVAAGHSGFKQETLDEISRRRPFLHALEVMKVPYCRSIGSLAPVNSLTDTKVRNHHGNDAVIIPISAQRRMGTKQQQQQRQQTGTHSLLAPPRLGGMQAARPMSSPQHDRKPPHVNHTRATTMAAFVRPAGRHACDGAATSGRPERPVLRFSSKRAKPGRGASDETAEAATGDAFHAYPDVTSGSLAAGSSIASTHESSLQSLGHDFSSGSPWPRAGVRQKATLGGLRPRHGSKHRSKGSASAPSLGTPAHLDSQTLGSTAGRLPTPSASDTEEDGAFSGLDSSDGFENLASWQKRPHSQSKDSLLTPRTLGGTTFFDPCLDEQVENFHEAVASLPSDPPFPPWDSLTSETVMLHCDAFLREQEAFDEKRALMRRIAREGQTSATRAMIAKNLQSRLQQEEAREQRVRQDTHRCNVSIKNCLSAMQQSRRELNTARKRYESIQNCQRYDWVGSVFRNNSTGAPR